MNRPVWSVRCALFALLALGCLLPGACGGGGGGGSGGDGVSAEELEARRARIRAFFAARRAARDVVATTTTDAGQMVDWIWPASQVESGAVAEPPVDLPSLEAPESVEDPPFTEPPEGGDAEAEEIEWELERQEHAGGPEGTVPIAVFDVEAYLASVEIPPARPEDVFQKMPAPSPDASGRYYALWRHSGLNYGTEGRINVWDPHGPVGKEMAIAQLAITGGSPVQTIEAGTIEYQPLNGDKRPHFFIFYTTNGYEVKGDQKGGYNTSYGGWVQVSKVAYPGAAVMPVSQTQGVQRELTLLVWHFLGNWWIRAGPHWIGYYPGGIFSTNGLNKNAQQIRWYGEVFDSSAPAATSTDMGSGAFADTGWGHAAYFRNVTHVWHPLFQWWIKGGFVYPTDSSCYTLDGPGWNMTPLWMNWFFFGGPGQEGPACN